MIIKFLDTQTGETAWSDYPFSIYWWAEGNGACDCNRALCFEGHEDTCGEQPYRYQAVAIGVHPDKSIDEQLAEVNDRIVEHYKLRTEEDVLKAINNGLY